MALKLVNLDKRTRDLMVKEIDYDISRDKLYLSPRLNTRGEKDYPRLLREAAEKYDDAWLADQLRSNGLMETVEKRRKPNGGTTSAHVPVTAPDTLAEGEFNRFYIRALCQRAVEDKIPALVIYRAKNVSSPRRESLAKTGEKIDPQRLLEELQGSQGVDNALGLPPGPYSGLKPESNSGLSVRLP